MIAAGLVLCAGIVVGIVAAVGLAISTVWLLIHHKRRKTHQAAYALSHKVNSSHQIYFVQGSFDAQSVLTHHASLFKCYLGTMP